MSSPCVLCFSSFLLCIFSTISSALHSPLTLPEFHTNPSRDPYQTISHLVSSSLTGAHHLKTPQTTTKKAASSTTTPLFSHSYGGYSISQLWYSSSNPPIRHGHCPFSAKTMSSFGSLVPIAMSAKTAPFLPPLKEISDLLSLNNLHLQNLFAAKTRNVLGSATPTQLNAMNVKTNSTPQNCTQICPPYLILYGSGTTGGVALSETLNLGHRTVPDFLVGCSVFSSRQPAGIAGFGRGLPSLPTQLKLDKFSYCLISRRFDDSTSSSTLILDSNSDFDKKTNGLTYTLLLKNPFVQGKEAFKVYYYIGLRKITLGGRHLKVPYKYLSPGNDGDGSTIVDSGSTFTFMALAREIFEPVAEESVEQVENYSRTRDIEVLIGLRPCFVVKSRDKPSDHLSAFIIKFSQATVHGIIFLIGLEISESNIKEKKLA